MKTRCFNEMYIDIQSTAVSYYISAIVPDPFASFHQKNINYSYSLVFRQFFFFVWYLYYLYIFLYHQKISLFCTCIHEFDTRLKKSPVILLKSKFWHFFNWNDPINQNVICFLRTQNTQIMSDQRLMILFTAYSWQQLTDIDCLSETSKELLWHSNNSHIRLSIMTNHSHFS